MDEKKEYFSLLEIEKKLFPAIYKKNKYTPKCSGTGLVEKIFK